MFDVTRRKSQDTSNNETVEYINRRIEVMMTTSVVVKSYVCNPEADYFGLYLSFQIL